MNKKKVDSWAVIDSACDDFESAWRADHRARIEPYLLRSADAQVQAIMAAELIPLEIELRQGIGEPADRSDYLDRFPSLSTVVQQVFDSQRSTHVTSGSGAAPMAPSGSGSQTFQATGTEYELLDEIARGGMGIVYRAHDRTFDRDVAVKRILDRYRNDEEAVNRFLGEAAITGRLQHPGIPPVHASGRDNSGIPFLVMKLIEGNTLAFQLKNLTEEDFKHRGRLIAIFEQICQAVGFAHTRGIVHRDLKPSNVMVGQFGEVQVMDWGLAKDTNQAAQETERLKPASSKAALLTAELSDQQPTRTGSVLGTPAYMAPEQAGGNLADIDAHSDVFGLGAILCQILTGKPPYTGGVVESILAQAVAGDTSDARKRLDSCEADPALIDLCLRCMASEKSDRPEDGAAVATEIARIRQTAEERAQRAETERAKAEVEAVEASKRRKLWRAAAAVVFTVLACGVAGTCWGLIKARHEAIAAEAARDQAVELARSESEAKEVALRQQQLAEKRLEQNNSLNQAMIDIFNGVDLSERNLTSEPIGLVLTKRLKDLAIQLKGDEFGNELAVSKMQTELANALFYSGMNADAESLYRDALKTIEETYGKTSTEYLNAANGLAVVIRTDGRPGKAADLLAGLVPISTELFGPDAPMTLNVLGNLAVALHQSGEFQQAIALHADVVERGRALFGETHPQYLTYLHNQAMCLHYFGDHLGALVVFEQLAAIYDEDPDVSDFNKLQLHSNISSVYSAAGEHEKAIRSAKQQIEQLEQRLGPESSSVLETQSLLGRAYFSSGDYEQAISTFDALIDRADSMLGAKHAFTIRARQALANSYAMLGKAEESADLYSRIITILKATFGPEHQLTLDTLHQYGGSLMQLEQWTAAENVLREVDEQYKQLEKHESPSALTNRSKLAGALQYQGKHEESIDLFGKILASMEKIHRGDHPEVLIALQRLGYAELVAGRLRQAIPRLKAAYESIIELYGIGHNESVTFALALTEAYVKNNQIDEAIQTLEPVVTEAKKTLSGSHYRLLTAVSWLANLKWRGGDPEAAAEAYQLSVELWEKNYGRRHKQTQIDIANLGVCLFQSDQAEKAVPLFEEVYNNEALPADLKWVGPWLIDSYFTTNRIDEAVSLVDRVIADQREANPAGSTQLAQQLAMCGSPLIRAGLLEKAEPLIRESLEIRQEKEPDLWSTFSTMAMLGGLLFEKGEFKKSEELLLAGYEGMISREDKIPAPARPRLGEAIKWLVELHAATERPEEMAKWEQRLAAFNNDANMDQPSQ